MSIVENTFSTAEMVTFTYCLCALTIARARNTSIDNKLNTLLHSDRMLDYKDVGVEVTHFQFHPNHKKKEPWPAVTLTSTTGPHYKSYCYFVDCSS